MNLWSGVFVHVESTRLGEGRPRQSLGGTQPRHDFLLQRSQFNNEGEGELSVESTFQARVFASDVEVNPVGDQMTAG